MQCEMGMTVMEDGHHAHEVHSLSYLEDSAIHNPAAPREIPRSATLLLKVDGNTFTC